MELAYTSVLISTTRGAWAYKTLNEIEIRIAQTRPHCISCETYHKPNQYVLNIHYIFFGQDNSKIKSAQEYVKKDLHKRKCTF